MYVCLSFNFNGRMHFEGITHKKTEISISKFTLVNYVPVLNNYT